MYNLFFTENEKIEKILDYELFHADIRPYLGFYLSVEFKKILK